MSTSSDEGWQELQTLSRRQCPKLFYQYSTKDQSLTLLLTDLISIWETSPDKYDILAAAARQHTSIDPSISSTQFDLLLSKIRKSLSGGRNSIARGNVRSTQSLSLRTTFDMPGGLRPLEWTFNLEPQATAELAERILRPSLHEVSVSHNKISSLLKVIRDKDHVITRLSERLASSDTDLSLVFPGIAGFASRRGRHVSVADAKRHVPGMTVFEEKPWAKQFANDDGYEGADTTGLINLVRGCEKCFVHSKTEHEDWIKDLPATLDEGHKFSHDAHHDSTPNPSAKRNSATKEDSTDDEFERQPTPPHLKSKEPPAKSARPVPRSDKTESEDEDEDGPPPAKRAKPSKIGGLGRRERVGTNIFPMSQAHPAKASSPAKKAPSSPPRRASIASTATETASEDDEVVEVVEEPIARRTRRSKSPQTLQKPKDLGLGKAKKLSLSPSATPSPSPSPQPPSPIPTRSRTTDTTSKDNDNDSRANARVQAHDDDETESEDDDDDLDPSSSPPPKAKATRNPPKRLGGLKKQPPAPSAPTRGKDTDAGTGTRNASLRAHRATSTASESPEPPKKSKSKSETESDSGSNSKSKAKDKATSKPSKLGGLRKKAKLPQSQSRDAASASPLASASPPPSRSTNPASAPAPVPESPTSATAPQNENAKGSEKERDEETPEQAAQRRRAELKRTIASTAARKKRRF